MEEVFYHQDLIDEIVNQASLPVLVDMMEINSLFRQRVNNFLKTPGNLARFGAIDTVQEFFDVYYTTYLRPESRDYLSPQACIDWALEESNLILANRFFEEIRFAGDLEPDDFGYFFSAAIKAPDTKSL